MGLLGQDQGYQVKQRQYGGCEVGPRAEQADHQDGSPHGAEGTLAPLSRGGLAGL